MSSGRSEPQVEDVFRQPLSWHSRESAAGHAVRFQKSSQIRGSPMKEHVKVARQAPKRAAQLLNVNSHRRRSSEILSHPEILVYLSSNACYPILTHRTYSIYIFWEATHNVVVLLLLRQYGCIRMCR